MQDVSETYTAHPRCGASPCLGLAIAKKIVERHGGRIWLESQARQGHHVFVHARHELAARQEIVMKVEGRPIEILLVEDNAADVRLTIEALREGKVRNNLSVARDGAEAMEFLRRRGQFENAPRPDLLLLDLNLPRKDGREVLAEIKEDPDLRTIPVVVLTTSSAEADILKSHALHANCYITKPVDLEQLIGVVRSIDDFWLTIVRLPKGAHP